MVITASSGKELICGHHKTAPIPGGFGAAAGPNDGWHCALHNLTKAFTRAAVKWGSCIQLRKRMDELEMSVQGNPSTKTLGEQVCSNCLFVCTSSSTVHICISREYMYFKCMYIHIFIYV